MGSKLKRDTTEPVRIDKAVVKKVRDYKKKEKVPIGVFFEKAALKELAHIELQESEKIKQ